MNASNSTEQNTLTSELATAIRAIHDTPEALTTGQIRKRLAETCPDLYDRCGGNHEIGPDGMAARIGRITGGRPRTLPGNENQTELTGFEADPYITVRNDDGALAKKDRKYVTYEDCEEHVRIREEQILADQESLAAYRDQLPDLKRRMVDQGMSYLEALADMRAAAE